jgi:hypothetical protein
MGWMALSRENYESSVMSAWESAYTHEWVGKSAVERIGIIKPQTRQRSLLHRIICSKYNVLIPSCLIDLDQYHK